MNFKKKITQLSVCAFILLSSNNVQTTLTKTNNSVHVPYQLDFITNHFKSNNGKPLVQVNLRESNLAAFRDTNLSSLKNTLSREIQTKHKMNVRFQTSNPLNHHPGIFNYIVRSNIHYPSNLLLLMEELKSFRVINEDFRKTSTTDLIEDNIAFSYAVPDKKVIAAFPFLLPQNYEAKDKQKQLKMLIDVFNTGAQKNLTKLFERMFELIDNQKSRSLTKFHYKKNYTNIKMNIIPKIYSHQLIYFK